MPILRPDGAQAYNPDGTLAEHQVDVSDYAAIFRAKWAGIPVTEFLAMPTYWTERIAVAMQAEADANAASQAASLAKSGTPIPSPDHKPSGVVQGVPRLGL